MCTNTKNQTVYDIGNPTRVWAVPAIHGDLKRLISLHDHILQEFRLGDSLVYLGNYTGYSKDSAACVEEIITFRRLLLSHQGMKPQDLVYLRGAQEEMWQKLLQLPFAPDPMSILLWMLGNGLSGTLESYGLCPHDGIEACKRGVMGLTKWTDKIRQAVRTHAGHETFNTQLVRAAHTEIGAAYPILFVNAGVNPGRDLHSQGDNLWWSSINFEDIMQPYLPFKKVVRGYDHKHKGVHVNCVTATIDGGCGFGGQLVGAAFEQSGELTRMIEV